MLLLLLKNLLLFQDLLDKELLLHERFISDELVLDAHRKLAHLVVKIGNYWLAYLLRLYVAYGHLIKWHHGLMKLLHVDWRRSLSHTMILIVVLIF